MIRGQRITEARIAEQRYGKIPGSDSQGLFPEDTLPLPRCTRCKELGFYRRGKWWHHDPAIGHDFLEESA